MPVGRPPKFDSPEQLEGLIEAYFETCETPKTIGDNIYFEPMTITGLCLALDTTRETLCDYENKPEYSDTVKRAKMRVENYAERMLHAGKNQTGAIFALKNFGWRDKTEQEVSGTHTQIQRIERVVTDVNPKD